MQTAERFFEKMNSFSEGNSKIITNAFFNSKQIEELIALSNVIIKYSDNCVIILEENEELVRLYFYSRSKTTLSEIESLIPNYMNKPIICDIVEKKKLSYNLTDLLIKQRFQEHNVLIRMSKSLNDDLPTHYGDIILAINDDIKSIMNMLYKEFDTRTSRLPTEEKVAEAVKNKQILIFKTETGNMLGLAYFESLGTKKKYLYQIVVDKNVRGRGIGERLLVQGYSQFEKGTICYLWVEASNQSAIRLYEKHGFKPDGLVDYILQFNKGGIDRTYDGTRRKVIASGVPE